MEGNLGEHHSGEIHRASADAKAERIIAEELKRNGRSEADLAAGRKNEPLRLLELGLADLETLPKGQLEKQVLAWWLYGQTTVKRRWLAEKLSMGYETRVSQAVDRVERSRQPEVLALKNKLTNYGL